MNNRLLVAVIVNGGKIISYSARATYGHRIILKQS